MPYKFIKLFQLFPKKYQHKDGYSNEQCMQSGEYFDIFFLLCLSKWMCNKLSHLHGFFSWDHLFKMSSVIPHTLNVIILISFIQIKLFHLKFVHKYLIRLFTQQSQRFMFLILSLVQGPFVSYNHYIMCS